MGTLYRSKKVLKEFMKNIQLFNNVSDNPDSFFLNFKYVSTRGIAPYFFVRVKNMTEVQMKGLTLLGWKYEKLED